MSRILVESIANIGKLIKNVKNVSLKSSSLTSCNVKCVPSMMQSFERSYSTKAESENCEALKYSTGQIKPGSIEEFIAEEVAWRFFKNRMGLFVVGKQDGADVEFYRHFNNEKITIKFNMNGSLKILRIRGLDYKSDVNKTREIRPSFTVEINKDKEKNLVFKLRYSIHGSVLEQLSFPDFDILSFAIAKNGEVDNTTYSILGDNMDRNVRSCLKEMLEERGVNESFLYNFREWAINYYEKLYRGGLEDLDKHVK